MLQRFAILSLVLTAWFLPTAHAQTSSLLVDAQANQQAAQRAVWDRRNSRGPQSTLSPDLAEVSLIAVKLPPPREFAMHDIVHIIVRESIENNSTASLETEKQMSKDGSIDAFPRLQLEDLLAFQLNQSNLSGNQPRVAMDFKQDFEGEGTGKRRDTFTTRIASRIIDVKPNGTLVLEARKFIQNDSESVNMILTGTCRPDDITADNTVMSTQLYDLQLIKETAGELRRAAKKGWLTKLFDGIFAF